MHTQAQTPCMNKLLAKSQELAYVFIPLVFQPAMSYLGLQAFDFWDVNVQIYIYWGKPESLLF